MKEKLVRWKFYFDKDKEEQWLNEMAAKGWSMKSFFAGRYTFEQTQPGEYLYQVELLPRNVKEKAEYLHFLEHEMGVELVQEWGFWIFLRKKANEGAFELYTDAVSKAEHYRKISHLFLQHLDWSFWLDYRKCWHGQHRKNQNFCFWRLFCMHWD